MSLNIRQGFYPIWIALSELLVAGVVAVAAIQALRSAPAIDRFYYSLQLDKLVPAGTAEVETFPEWFLTERTLHADGVTLVLPIPAPQGLWAAYESIAAAKQGAPVVNDERGPGEAYQTVVPASAMPELVQRAKRLQLQARVRKAGSILVAALIPPALLLLLGIAIRNPRKGTIHGQ